MRCSLSLTRATLSLRTQHMTASNASWCTTSSLSTCCQLLHRTCCRPFRRRARPQASSAQVAAATGALRGVVALTCVQRSEPPLTGLAAVLPGVLVCLTHWRVHDCMPCALGTLQPQQQPHSMPVRNEAAASPPTAVLRLMYVCLCGQLHSLPGLRC